MTTEEKERAPSVSDFLTPSPSLPFVLRRKQEDGSVKDFPFRCRVLRPGQLIDALQMAQGYAKEKETDGYGDIYREAQAHESIQRLMCRPDPVERADGLREYRPMFISAEQVRNSLNELECAQILNCYEITKAFYKTTDNFSSEDIEKMIDGLADEMAGPFFLSRLDSSDWPELITSLARLVQVLMKQIGPTPSSSPSSSESDPSNSENGTTGSSQLPDAQSLSFSGELPTDRLMTQEEARGFVMNERNRKPEKED
jgi:hypothetical protein